MKRGCLGTCRSDLSNFIISSRSQSRLSGIRTTQSKKTSPLNVIIVAQFNQARNPLRTRSDMNEVRGFLKYIVVLVLIVVGIMSLQYIFSKASQDQSRSRPVEYEHRFRS